MPEVPTTQPASLRAIFVSYSHDDAAAARRVAEALRAAGLEVWFDENELRGGDTWDQKIKQQIRDCALFLPVISQNTQRRREGYFRLEWHLAEERSRLIARGTPFLVPVAIDDVPERGALVPEVFLSVQWTRLPGGEATAAFGERVKALLANEVAPASSRQTPEAGRMPALPRQVGRRAPAAAWLSFAAVAAIAIASYLAVRPSPNAVAGTRPPTPEKSAATPATTATAPRLGPKSIAVLPFENLSEAKDDNAFFAEGMHEDVINHLVIIRELRCIPRATSLTYRATQKSPRAIADELGVAFLLNGTVRRAGSQLRLTATLFNPRTDETLWTKSYDNKNVTEIFAIQTELAQAISSELKATLSPGERQSVSLRATNDPAAYDLFLKARLERNNATGGPADTLERQIAALEAAVARDPQFATAWAYLGRAYALYYRNNFDHSAARLELARSAIERALQLDPESPDVTLNTAEYYHFCFRDFAKATEACEKAIRLRPNSPQNFFVLANLQRCQNRWLESWDNYHRAAERDPAFIDGWSQMFNLAVAGRRFHEARPIGQRMASLLRAAATPDNRDLPNHADGWVAWLSFQELGATAEVQTVIRQLEANPRTSGYARFLRLYAAAETGDAAEVVKLDTLQPARDYHGVIRAACALAALGQRDAVITRIGDLPDRLRERLAREPDNDTIWRNLSRLEALLGHKEEALRCAHEAIKRVSLARDSWWGTYAEADLAFVYAWTGETTRAIAAYEKLLSIPTNYDGYVTTVHSLKRGIWYAPLRGDPRFEALINDPKNNAPLF